MLSNQILMQDTIKYTHKKQTKKYKWNRMNGME